MQFGPCLCSLVQLGADWYSLVLLDPVRRPFGHVEAD